MGLQKHMTLKLTKLLKQPDNLRNTLNFVEQESNHALLLPHLI